MNPRAIILTLLLFAFGFLLEHLPMPSLLSWFHPPWMLLIVTLLVLHAPHWFGVWLALPIGLLLDVEHHQLLGLNVLTLTIHISLLRAFYYRMQHFNNVLLTVIVIVLVIIHQLVGSMALWVMDTNTYLPVWQPALGTALVWLWLRALFSTVTAKPNFK